MDEPEHAGAVGELERIEVVVAGNIVAREEDALDEFPLRTDATDLGQVRPELVTFVADLVAGEAGAASGFIDGAAGDRVAFLHRGLGQWDETFLLGFVGREGGVKRRLKDFIDLAWQEAECFAHKILAERTEHRRLTEGDGDLSSGVPGDTLVVLRHGERDEEFTLLERAGVRQQREISVPLRRGQLRVGETSRSVHAQSRIRRIDEEVGEQLERGVAKVFATAREGEERLEAERRRFRRVSSDCVQGLVEALVLHAGKGVEQERRGTLGELRLERRIPELGVDLARLGRDGA